MLTTVLYWCVVGIASGFVLAYLGADGGNCPIQSYKRYWFSIYNITFFQKYLLIVVTGYLGWLFVAALVMFLSAKCGSAALPVIATPRLILVPTALSSEIDNTKILGLLHHQLFNLFSDMESLTVYTLLGKVMTPMPIVLTVYSVLTVFLFWRSYRVFRFRRIK